MVQNASKLSYKYNVFGFNIISEIPVICFDESKFETEPDIYIKIGETPENINNKLQEGTFYQASENDFLLKIPYNANFYIKNGKEVTVEPFKNVKIEELSTFISGRILGILLHQRKLNPIHGGAIRYKEKVIAFPGISGAGKSTIITAMSLKGAELISDDLLLFSFDDNSIKLVPSFPYVKLWEDSLKYLKIQNKDKLIKVRKEIGKYYYRINNFSKTTVNLDYIIYITLHNKEKYNIEEIYGKNKFTLIKEMTYIFHNVKNTGILMSNFKICSMIASKIPIYVLTRPTEKSDLNEIIELIEKTLNL